MFDLFLRFLINFKCDRVVGPVTPQTRTLPREIVLRRVTRSGLSRIDDGPL